MAKRGMKKRTSGSCLGACCGAQELRQVGQAHSDRTVLNAAIRSWCIVLPHEVLHHMPQLKSATAQQAEHALARVMAADHSMQLFGCAQTR